MNTALDKTSSIVVVGDGWAALASVISFATSARPVLWITHSAARIDAPLASLDTSIGDAALVGWKTLANALQLDLGEAEHGAFLREFRNKAFRQPSWTEVADLETRQEIKNEFLWPGERYVPALSEAQFEESFLEIEAKIRQRLAVLMEEDALPIEKISEDPITEIQVQNQKVTGLVLGSGKVIEANTIVFADRWSEIARIKGLPKSLPFTQKRESVGVLQATFTHDASVAHGVRESFFIPLHRESGETQERHIWGYFSDYGKRSHWTLCLTATECEDNHEIGKRYRRLKQALNKAFVGPTWVPADLGEKAEFMSNVDPQSGEVVRFEEHVLFSAGEPVQAPAHIKGVEGISFLTDGYGPSFAMTQVLALGQSEGLAAMTVELAPASEVAADLA